MNDIILKVTINGITEERNLSEDLRVDEEHVNDYLIRSPGLTAYWNTLYQQSKTLVQRTEVKLKRKYAELDRHYRSMKRSDTERIVNAEIEACIISNPEYQAIEDELLNLREQENLLKGAVDAINELRSTLISLSANLRSTGTLRIKDKVEAAEKRFREKFVV